MIASRALFFYTSAVWKASSSTQYGIVVHRAKRRCLLQVRWRYLAQDSKRVRQERLHDTLGREPFLTDGELASRFGVSVQTIRLDRLSLGIPELRERIRSLAVSRYDDVRTLAPEEVFGDIVDLELGKSGLSVWRADEEHVFARSSIVRGHYIFAQANSLAVAIVDAAQALTAKATIRFLRSARVGAYLVARARVCGERHGYVLVEVRTKVDGEEVLRADFLIMHGTVDAAGRAEFEDRD